MLDRLKERLKTSKVQRILFIVIFFIGFLAIIFRTLGYQNENTVDKNIRYADATVNSVSEYTSNEDEYLVSLSFEADGTKYDNINIQTPLKPSIGGTITITYYQDSPTACWIEPPKPINMGLIVYYIIFVAVMITGIAGIIMISKGEKRIEQMKYRAEVEEQMQKDADEINTAKNAYYNIEPNPFDNNSNYNSVELFTGGDESDYSYMMDQHSVTDSYVDAETAYNGYDGQGDGQSYGANPFNDTNDYNNTLPNNTDTYANPFAPYSGYETNGTPNYDNRDVPPNSPDSYADPFAPYTGYDENQE